MDSQTCKEEVICNEIPYLDGSLTVHRRSSTSFWFRVRTINQELTGTVEFSDPYIDSSRLLASISKFYLDSQVKLKNELGPRELH